MRSVVPFSAAIGLATANGRPQRAAVLAMYAHALGLAGNTPHEPVDNGVNHEFS